MAFDRKCTGTFYTKNLAETEPDDEADAERGVELGDNSIFEILFGNK